MALKKYQERVLGEVKDFLDKLAAEQSGGNLKHASQDAWEAANAPGGYKPRKASNGRDLPTFCLKVPTGGGKTLLATQVIGQAHKALLAARNGAGLVLWVVPSDQIYRDTLKALRDPAHFYRESLQHAVSRRVEVWEKHEIARLTPGQLSTALNILIVKLQGTNREDKESLKFFRDSGGNVTLHFPPEDDADGHKALKEKISNLDMLVEDAAKGQYLATTSIGNLVRLCEPVVILDEGHKATSRLARETVEGFNPCLVVELSATPTADANVLCKVTGRQLLDEEMIKLPINIASSGEQSWQNCLTKARDKRNELAEKGVEAYRTSGKLIRPIVLVQAERTGKEQRVAGVIHSEDVREYLIQKLDIPAERVRVKTATVDEIAGVDLMDEDCPVEWIITKGALQEGWDCPYAYILVSLNNTRSKQSMTQLVGRVLRQPFQKRTPFPELNESYVYCLKSSAREVLKDVRAALEKEGYEGDAASVVDRTGTGTQPPAVVTSTIRPRFAEQYTKPKGKIYLPRFCWKDGKSYEKFDYFRHLLGGLDVSAFDYAAVEKWDFAKDLKAAREQYYRVTLRDDTEALEPNDVTSQALAAQETDASVMGWLAVNLAFSWLSAKRLREIVHKACSRISGVAGQMALVRFRLLERLTGFIQEETDKQTGVTFARHFAADRIVFYLECIECMFEIPHSIQRKTVKRLRRLDDSDVQRSLFDPAYEDEQNELEKDVALYLDEHEEVLWWYRNLAAKDQFTIQGHRRNLIYPDFVVQKGKDGKAGKATLFL